MSKPQVSVKGHSINEAWLALHDEPVIEPDLPIVDPHHHLWDQKPHSYLFHELLADVDSGHDVRATVYVDCAAMYRADGNPAFASVGEVEFVNGIAAMSASGSYGRARLCVGIVGHADLTRGGAARDTLVRLIQAAPERFKGIRHMGAYDPNPGITSLPTPPPPGLYGDARFREGFATLAPLGLSFDAWLYHPQLDDLIGLADAFPETTIIMDHMGGRIGIGAYADKSAEVDALWRGKIVEIAKRPNVVVKLGGFGMRLNGFRLNEAPRPPSSEALATLWRPYIESCLDAFGPARCMFESNFPVDKLSCSYKVLWHAFKRIAAGHTPEDKRLLFAGTATRVYRLPGALIACPPAAATA